MKPASQYNSGASFALLLIGPPKAGKTVFATCFPTPWVLDCDNNLAGAMRYHTSAGKPLSDCFFDDPQMEDKEGGPIARPSEAHILANSQQGNGMKDLIIAGEKVMNQSHWNPFKSMMMRFVMACRSAGKPFIMTCHEMAETNEDGNVIAYRPLISGQLRSNLAGLFTDCWRCETAIAPKDARHPLGVKYSVRFQPRNLMQIGNSLSIKLDELDVTGKSRVDIWSQLAPLLGMPTNLVA
jgi:hypothetical protein